MSAWKSFERRVAARLGLKRRPVTGLDRGDGDCFNELFEVQCKKRKGQPSYLREWLDGIVTTARARNRIGIVVWKESGSGRPDSDALVVLLLKDWIALHGSVALSPEDSQQFIEAPPQATARLVAAAQRHIGESGEK